MKGGDELEQQEDLTRKLIIKGKHSSGHELPLAAGCCVRSMLLAF
jgi:hypothetical protein